MRRRLLDTFNEEGDTGPQQGVVPMARRRLRTEPADQGVNPEPRPFTEHRRQLQGARRERQLRERFGDFRKGFGEELDVTDHNVADMSIICRYCHALRSPAEPT